MERIQGVLDLFGDRFLIHGGTVYVREDMAGDVVLAEASGSDDAWVFSGSDAYREIKHRRVDNVDEDLIIAEGVGPGRHRSGAVGDRVRQVVATGRVFGV